MPPVQHELSRLNCGKGSNVQRLWPRGFASLIHCAGTAQGCMVLVAWVRSRHASPPRRRTKEAADQTSGGAEVLHQWGEGENANREPCRGWDSNPSQPTPHEIESYARYAQRGGHCGDGVKLHGCGRLGSKHTNLSRARAAQRGDSLSWGQLRRAGCRVQLIVGTA